MKLIKSNGKTLEVYDIQQPIMKFITITVPLKENGYTIVNDDIARQKIRQITDCDLYKRIT